MDIEFLKSLKPNEQIKITCKKGKFKVLGNVFQVFDESLGRMEAIDDDEALYMITPNDPHLEVTRHA